jgi:hypothetical protein
VAGARSRPSTPSDAAAVLLPAALAETGRTDRNTPCRSSASSVMARPRRRGGLRRPVRPRPYPGRRRRPGTGPPRALHAAYLVSGTLNRQRGTARLLAGAAGGGTWSALSERAKGALAERPPCSAEAETRSSSPRAACWPCCAPRCCHCRTVVALHRVTVGSSVTALAVGGSGTALLPRQRARPIIGGRCDQLACG